MCGPADALGLADQPAPHGVHEVADMGVDDMIGALRIVGRFGVGDDPASGDPGRFETGLMVERVEVAVGPIAGIAGLRRPHPVGDLEVAAEGHHIGVGDRTTQCGIAVQRRSVDHEMPDPGGGVKVLHAGGVGALRSPDAGRGVTESLPGVGQPLAQRELAKPRVQQRLERMRQRPAEQLDGSGIDQVAQ